jgi:predicted transcriptional regulator
MPVAFQEAGYLEVWRGDVRVSRHRQEREAIESVLTDAATSGASAYEIRRGVIRVTVTRPDPIITGEINADVPLP